MCTAATHGAMRLTSVTTTSCRTSELEEMDREVLEEQDGDRDTHETEQERSGENNGEILYTSGSGSSHSGGLKYPTGHAPGATVRFCLLGLCTEAWPPGPGTCSDISE